MGPQLYRCGNLVNILETTHDAISFNGAATLSLRKFQTVSIVVLVSQMLQWGRNFIVAEIAQRPNNRTKQ